MKLSKFRTPLTAVPGLSDEAIVTLRSCGIRTWEEYCAYAHTLENVKVEGGDLFKGKVGVDVFESISGYKAASRPMGCTMPDACLARMKSACGETFAGAGRIDPAVGDFGEDNLPHEIRLMDRMPKVRDQGSRGTCTAFATTALCEFADGCSAQFSPQFLYWASKMRDGSPDSDGTSLDTVQETLFEDGVCHESFWPYNGKPIVDENGVLDAGQGPAPQEAVENAREHRLSCRTLSPNAVRQYRKILASGKPVVVGLATFRSWTRNRMTEETGRVPMPFMKKGEDGSWCLIEQSDGGHAMCLVGYVDDESAAGGGYFIVRNSWGEFWASECEEGAGHALIPYRYVALFAFSAFTIHDRPDIHDRPEPSSAAAMPKPSVSSMRSALDDLPLHLRPFARILDRETRDFRGALLPKGACVLSLPKEGSPVVEYRQGNFNSREYQEIVTVSRFPDRALWTEDLSAAYDTILRRKQEFCAKIDENISERSLKLKPFPEFRFSWNMLQVMGTQRIKSSSELCDFSESLFDALLDSALSGSLKGLENVPAAWREAMKLTVSAKIRKVSSLSFIPNAVYVVEVFATPFGIDGKTGALQFANPSSRFIETVRACAVTALKGVDKGKFVFYSIGTGLQLGHDISAVREGLCAITISGPADDGRWEVRAPGYLTGQASYRDFSDRLMPITREELMSAVKTYVDEVGRDSFKSGKVTVGEIIDRLHESTNGKFRAFPVFRQTAIIRSLLQMQGNDPGRYAVCKESRGAQEVFVIPKTEVQKDDKPYRGRGWFLNMIMFHSIHFLGLVICSAILIGKSEFEVWMGLECNNVARVFMAALTMLVCGFIQGQFNRVVSSVERS